MKTIPAVREAIEQKQQNVARQYVPVATTLDGYSARLDTATKLLGSKI